jgi:hypothetical protein
MLEIRGTEYLLQMELISLDERPCRTLERTKSLCERAEEFGETAEAQRIQEVNTILLFTKHLLDRLSQSSTAPSNSDSIEMVRHGRELAPHKRVRAAIPERRTIPGSVASESRGNLAGY